MVELHTGIFYSSEANEPETSSYFSDISTTSSFYVFYIKAFGVSIFYVLCFIWHYPRHTIGIIYAAGKVYKDKMIKSIKMWWQRMNTYSPYAQEVIRYRATMERCQSTESHDASDNESAHNI